MLLPSVRSFSVSKKSESFCHIEQHRVSNTHRAFAVFHAKVFCDNGFLARRKSRMGFYE